MESDIELENERDPDQIKEEEEADDQELVIIPLAVKETSRKSMLTQLWIFDCFMDLLHLCYDYVAWIIHYINQMNKIA